MESFDLTLLMQRQDIDFNLSISKITNTDKVGYHSAVLNFRTPQDKWITHIYVYKPCPNKTEYDNFLLVAAYQPELMIKGKPTRSYYQIIERLLKPLLPIKGIGFVQYGNFCKINQERLGSIDLTIIRQDGAVTHISGKLKNIPTLLKSG